MPDTPESDRKTRLVEFVDFVGAHLRGDEKGEAQVFLDRLFQAFGQPGTIEAGAVYEDRLKRPNRRGVNFADLVWGETLLVEMKKRGEPLAKHTQQMLDYWVQLAGRRPAYCLLCNFDEFWVYDFNKDILGPVDRLTLGELPDRFGALAFLFPTGETPVFGDDHEAVTRAAADRLAALFRGLTGRGVERETAQRFTLQALVTLFAEDIGLLDRYFLTRLLEECTTPELAYDRLGGLFSAMNTEGGVPGGRYKGVRYFNGGLFAEPSPIELEAAEVTLLREAAEADWSKVRPEIFGTIFEHSMDGDERHAFGAHFTSQLDILKIVKPTIVDPWEALIERTMKGAKPVENLNLLHQRLQTYRVLDPACGSGNFLYLAYRELKRVEARLIEAIQDVSREKTPMFGRVTAQQFFGIDINGFAVELAKVTLMIARKLAIDELHTEEAALPLDRLDDNFRVGDALIEFDGSGEARRPDWFAADVIIGNPPFLDARKITMAHGIDYSANLERLYPDITRRSDLCVYWIRRSHDQLPYCSSNDPVSGRAGLVGTQNIRNNESREGGLDHVVQSGVIVEAVDNQPWSGEANVHVSIANWVKAKDPSDSGEPQLVPELKKLWTRVSRSKTSSQKRAKDNRGDKTYFLEYRLATTITSALSDGADLSATKILECNTTPKRSFEGQQPGHKGFRISRNQAEDFLAACAECSDCIFPYINGTALLTERWKTSTEFVIDFGERDVLQAQSCGPALEHIRSAVLPKWEKNAREEFEKTGRSTGEHQRRMQTWWRLKRSRQDLVRSIASMSRYMACSRVTKRPIFAFLDSAWRPDSSLQVFALCDDFSFGLLSSDAHWQWFIAKCSKLKSDFRYTPQTVWDTFPWPQSPSVRDVLAVAEAGRAVRAVRDGHLPKIKGGLRALYRTLELPGKSPLRDAHAALDAAVLKAYGFSAKKDLLAQILELNLAVAAAEGAEEPVTAPGIPAGFLDGGGDAAALVTSDCIRAD